MSTRAARLPRPAALRPRLAAEVATIGVVLAAAAYVWTRDLHTYPNFDEGNYLGSLDALRHGQQLGRDVFLDQPPGWYLLLAAVSYPFGNSVSGVRAGLMATTLVAVVAAYACGRLVGGPVAGLVAGAVMAVARPLPGFAGLVESEPASAALAVAAVVLAVAAYRRRFRPWLAVSAGAVLTLATSVKLPGATAALPIFAIAVLCGSGPLLRRLAVPVAGALTVCGAFAAGYHDVLPQIWHGVFTTHARILGQGTAASNTHRAVTFVDPRTPFGCLVIAGAAASIVVAVRGHERPLLASLWLWTIGGYAFVLAMHPLSDHHLVFLAVSLALPAGVGLGLLIAQVTTPALAAALVLAVGTFVGFAMVKDHREIVGANVQEPPEMRWAVTQLHAHTRPDQLVVSDLPAVAYLADRRMPGQLIDTSIARIAFEDLTPQQVLHLVDTTGASAAVIGRMFQTKPEIVAGIRRRFAHRLHQPISIGGYVDVLYGRRR
jgi:4-amino-4-deoxy-L-arabinose transferase-like glycosyltransferase